jgi:hypothetical protein
MPSAEIDGAEFCVASVHNDPAKLFLVDDASFLSFLLVFVTNPRLIDDVGLQGLDVVSREVFELRHSALTQGATLQNRRHQLENRFGHVAQIRDMASAIDGTRAMAERTAIQAKELGPLCREFLGLLWTSWLSNELWGSVWQNFCATETEGE